MIDPATSMGTPGQAMATYDVLRSPRESWSTEVMPRPGGGSQVVVQHKMDGYGLWVTSESRVIGTTVLKQVKYALSREGLFDAP